MSENPSPQKSAHGLRTWILLALTVAAVIVVCMSVGQTKYVPFSPFTINNPHTAVSNEHGSVVVDSESGRLLFLDPSDQLVSAVELDRYEIPIKEANLLSQDGEFVYVAGATRADDGESVVSEAVLLYSVDGLYLEKLWEKKYEDGEGPAVPSVTDLTVTGNGDLMITRVDGTATMATSAELIKVNDKGEEEPQRSLSYPQGVPIHDADYLADANRLLLVSESGDVALEGEPGKEATVLYQAKPQQRYQKVVVYEKHAGLYNSATGELLYAGDFVGASQLMTIDSGLTIASLSLNKNLLTAVLDDGIVRVYDLSKASDNPADFSKNAELISQRELSKLTLSPILNVSAVLLVLAWLYLIGLAVVLALRWLIRSFRQDNRANLRRAVLSVMVTLLAMVTVGGHFVQTFSISTFDRVNQIKQSALFVASRSPETIGDASQREAMRLTGELELEANNTDYLILRHTVESLMQSYYQSSQGVQCNIYAVSADGSDVRYLLSSQRDAVLGARVSDQKTADMVRDITAKAKEGRGSAAEKASRVVQEDLAAEVERKETRSVMYGYAVPLFASDGSCRAVAEMSFQGETFLQHQIEQLASTLMEFGLIAIGIYVLFDELVLSGHAWLTFRGLRERGEGSAHTLLARPLMFASSVTAAVDTSLAVVIAKEMLTRAGVESNAFVWGIPALAITLGQTLGAVLHGAYISRVPGRRLVVPLAAASMGALVLCGFAVMNNWFAAFVAGKFVMGVGYQVVSLTAKTLAGGINKESLGGNEEVFAASRAVVIASARPARIVAGILSGLLALAGNQWIYFGASVLGAVVLGLSVAACPKNTVLAKLNEKSLQAHVTRFVFSPKMLCAAVFAALPVIIAGGYRSFIFPLFLEGAALSKTQIANLFVVGEAVVYFAMNWLITVRDSHDRWKSTWLGMLGLGVTFGLLSLNQSPVWAVLAIVFINALSWFAGDWKWQARKWAKVDCDLNYDQSSAVLSVESTAIKNLRAPILSGLVVLGGPICCLVLGALYAVCSALYALTTRRYR